MRVGSLERRMAQGKGSKAEPCNTTTGPFARVCGREQNGQAREMPLAAPNGQFCARARGDCHVISLPGAGTHPPPPPAAGVGRLRQVLGRSEGERWAVAPGASGRSELTAITAEGSNEAAGRAIPSESAPRRSGSLTIVLPSTGPSQNLGRSFRGMEGFIVRLLSGCVEYVWESS